MCVAWNTRATHMRDIGFHLGVRAEFHSWYGFVFRQEITSTFKQIQVVAQPKAFKIEAACGFRGYDENLKKCIDKKRAEVLAKTRGHKGPKKLRRATTSVVRSFLGQPTTCSRHLAFPTHDWLPRCVEHTHPKPPTKLDDLDVLCSEKCEWWKQLFVENRTSRCSVGTNKS